MVFDCRSSLRVRNPCQWVYVFNSRAKCEQVERSVHLYSNSNFVYVLVSLVVNLIKSHFFSIVLPSSVSVLGSICISSSSSCPFYFRARRIANTHLHSESLKDCPDLNLVLITIWVKESLEVFSLLCSYVFYCIPTN